MIPTNLEDIQQAREVIIQQKEILALKKKLLNIVLIGLKSVAHHVKLTSRVEKAIGAQLRLAGLNTLVSVNNGKILLWGGMIKYDNRFSIYGETIPELISQVENMSLEKNFSTEALDKTEANLQLVGEFLERKERLKKEISEHFPAFYAINDIHPFRDLFRF